MISIIPYQDKYSHDFKRLNLQWLEQYQLTESHDLEILDDPKGKVLNGGGAIFLAMDGDKVVGTAGIARDNDQVFELVKMAVDPQYQGKGISKTLLNECLQLARARGAKKIYLWSNSQLKTALTLYEKNGFRHVTPENSPMLTADVKMELNL